MKKPTAREMAIQKSIELPEQEVLKVLIFIAGMEAGKHINEEQSETEQPCKPPKQTA